MKRQNVNEFILLSHRRWPIMLYIGRIYKWLSMVQKKQDMAGHRDWFGFDFGYRLDRIGIIQTEASNVSHFQKRNKLWKTFSEIQLTLLTGLKNHFDLDWQNIKIVCYSADFQQDKHFELSFLDRTNNV